MKKLDTTEKLFTKEQAIKVAAELQAGDPDWKYVPVHDPSGKGFSYIEIRDENNEFVGKV